jgi:tRNA (guanosine-2'-O-)-methyltransferase
MNIEEKQALIEYLNQFITAERRQRIETVLQQRTRHITIILEDLYQAHNASACLRSCDGFGLQDVHIVENRNLFNLNRDVSLGSDRWLTLYHYRQPKINNTQDCIHQLKQAGYQIVATTPHEQEKTLDCLPIDQKIALVFGTELNGISETAQSQADQFVRIPMVGFCESFNISVSVALCLYDLTIRLRKSAVHWQLTEAEKQELRHLWIRQSIRAGQQIEQRFMQQITS